MMFNGLVLLEMSYFKWNKALWFSLETIQNKQDKAKNYSVTLISLWAVSKFRQQKVVRFPEVDIYSHTWSCSGTEQELNQWHLIDSGLNSKITIVTTATQQRKSILNFCFPIAENKTLLKHNFLKQFQFILKEQGTRLGLGFLLLHMGISLLQRMKNVTVKSSHFLLSWNFLYYFFCGNVMTSSHYIQDVIRTTRSVVVSWPTSVRGHLLPLEKVLDIELNFNILGMSLDQEKHCSFKCSRAKTWRLFSHY